MSVFFFFFFFGGGGGGSEERWGLSENVYYLLSQYQDNVCLWQVTSEPK